MQVGSSLFTVTLTTPRVSRPLFSCMSSYRWSVPRALHTVNSSFGRKRGVFLGLGLLLFLGLVLSRSFLTPSIDGQPTIQKVDVSTYGKMMMSAEAA